LYVLRRFSYLLKNNAIMMIDFDSKP